MLLIDACIWITSGLLCVLLAANKQDNKYIYGVVFSNLNFTLDFDGIILGNCRTGLFPDYEMRHLQIEQKTQAGIILSVMQTTHWQFCCLLHINVTVTKERKTNRQKDRHTSRQTDKQQTNTNRRT